MIHLRLNGEPRELCAPASILELLRAYDVELRTIAVAHNGVVVPRERLEEIQLSDGDEVEVVRMVGGG